ncbi:ALP1-like protein [Tanacetum coccineum]
MLSSILMSFSLVVQLPIFGGLFVVGVTLKSRRYLPVMNGTYGTPRGKLQKSRKTELITGDSGSEPFILLEAVASQDLWIWHAFFSVAGSNNDVNVLRQSPVLNDLKVGKAPEVPFVANDVTYKWGYYLTGRIYPKWAVLMKYISQSESNDVKRIRYKQAHEAARKDVERAFGVLKKK